MDQNMQEFAEQRFSAARINAMVRDVVRQWYLIAVVALIAGMAMFILKDMSYVPKYATSTTFVISSGGTSSSTFQNLSATRDLAEVFTEVLNSSLLQEKVMEQVGISSFDGSITASAVPETNLLTMQVTGSDPRTVFLVSKAIEEHHSVVSAELLEGVILEVLKEPSVPAYPVNPLQLGRSVKRGAVAAAACMVVLLGTMSIMSDRICSRTEADYKLGCRVMGELYHEKKYKTWKEKLHRKKSSVLISNPTTSFAYTEAVNKLASRVEKHMHGKKTLLLTSFLENEGKSTVAANLAMALSRRGKSVLLLDCDLRKPSCGLIMEQKSSRGVAEILAGKASLQECMIHVEKTNVYLVTAAKGVRNAADLLASPLMPALLEGAAESFDYVLLDTPPMSLAPDAEYLGGLCSASMLVARQNTALAADINDCAATLERSGTHMLGCVLNNVFGSGGFAPAYQAGGYGSYRKYGYSRYGYGYGEKHQ